MLMLDGPQPDHASEADWDLNEDSGDGGPFEWLCIPHRRRMYLSRWY